MAFLAQNGETGLHDLCYFTGAARKTVEVLAQTGTVCLREQETYRITEKQYTVKAIPITLNDEQQQVYEDVLRQVQWKSRCHAAAGRYRQRQNAGLYPAGAGAAAAGAVRDDPGAGDRADASDDGAVHRLFRR